MYHKNRLIEPSLKVGMMIAGNSVGVGVFGILLNLLYRLLSFRMCGIPVLNPDPQQTRYQCSKQRTNDSKASCKIAYICELSVI